METGIRITPVIPATPVIPRYEDIVRKTPIIPIPRYDNVDESGRIVIEPIPALQTRYVHSNSVTPGTVRYGRIGYFDEDGDLWKIEPARIVYLSRNSIYHFVCKDVIDLNKTIN